MLALVLAALVVAQPQPMRIGPIDFFGTADLDTSAIRTALPIHPGDSLTEAEMEALKARVDAVVRAKTGAAATDVSGVCCDADQRLLLYIGLPGSNAKTIERCPAPSGKSCLPPPALELYERAMTAMEHAVSTGDTGEDHSNGYALSHEPESRARQMEMRTYAVEHPGLMETTLRSCGRADDRRAAAHLLGYANPSATAMQALVRAAADPDAAVRNNAVRALWVIADSGRPAAARIPVEPFVAMLNSRTWEDRNKAGLLLSTLSARRSPALFDALRHEAMTSLVEMARWQETSHALPSRLLLGRMAGIDEPRLHQLVSGGRVEDIVSAALAPGKR